MATYIAYRVTMAYENAGRSPVSRCATMRVPAWDSNFCKTVNASSAEVRSGLRTVLRALWPWGESSRAILPRARPGLTIHDPNHRAIPGRPPLPEPEKPRPLTEETEDRRLLNTSSLFPELRLPAWDSNFCKTVNASSAEVRSGLSQER